MAWIKFLLLKKILLAGMIGVLTCPLLHSPDYWHLFCFINFDFTFGLDKIKASRNIRYNRWNYYTFIDLTYTKNT
jgi:hypothetical protein